MTNGEFINMFNNNRSVVSVSMAKLGNCYEMCIQEMGVNMLQYLEHNPIQDWDDEEPLSKTIQSLDNFADENCTGAQLGAAKNLALVFHRQGYEKGLEMAPDNRIIMINKEQGVIHND